MFGKRNTKRCRRTPRLAGGTPCHALQEVRGACRRIATDLQEEHPALQEEHHAPKGAQQEGHGAKEEERGAPQEEQPGRRGAMPSRRSTMHRRRGIMPCKIQGRDAPQHEEGHAQQEKHHAK